MSWFSLVLLVGCKYFLIMKVNLYITKSYGVKVKCHVLTGEGDLVKLNVYGMNFYPITVGNDGF